MIDDHSDEEEEKDGDDDEDEDYTNLMNRLKMAEIQSKIHIFERNCDDDHHHHVNQYRGDDDLNVLAREQDL
ncbi:hypothetical protein DERP_003573 [Dermatophagoides pteronyssinus]|uniref:Uncharacterized protein n=1 Tax=Dermatophagoides pteronyssinus TaxID=6956 RepID=A0ABQ8JLR3_DERPT|nr:hypothetical protein DERP_003573 [Dermatophagoides pteronyssinus]